MVYFAKILRSGPCSQWHTKSARHLNSKIRTQSPIFLISLQSINNVGYTCLPTIHCIDSIYANFCRVALSDKASNQIPDHLPPVVLMLGATALRVGEKPCGLPPSTNPMMELLPEVMKTSGGRH